MGEAFRGPRGVQDRRCGRRERLADGVLQVMNFSAKPRGSRWRPRLLALILGTAASLLLCGGLVASTWVGIEGTERCEACGVQREVRWAGMLRSDPRPNTASASPDCGGHDWRRTGCWRTVGGYACYR